MSTSDPAAGPPADAPIGADLAVQPKPQRSAIRGFQFGGFHFKHMQTFAEHGWASQEGVNREAVTMFGLFRCFEHNIFQGWRLTVGRHSFWVLPVSTCGRAQRECR